MKEGDGSEGCLSLFRVSRATEKLNKFFDFTGPQQCWWGTAHHSGCTSLGKREAFIHDPVHATAKASPFFLDSPKAAAERQLKSVYSCHLLQSWHCAPTYGKSRMRGGPQNVSYSFAAFSFHPVATGRTQTWPTSVKCAFPCGLLDRALCLTLSDKTSADMQVGAGDGLSVDSTEVTISFICRLRFDAFSAM